MILKWQTFDGAWCVVDGITSIDNHGYRSGEVIHRLAEMYDGMPVLVHNTGRPVYTDYGRPDPEIDSNQPHADPDPPSLYLAIVFRDNRGREHWRLPDIQQGFLMSDDGKTVDRLLH